MKEDKEVEKLRKKHQQQQLTETMIVLFFVHLVLYDASIMLSQIWHLNLQLIVFELLLTMFNFQLTLVFQGNSDYKCSLTYLTYFPSGIFILVNILVYLSIGTTFHCLTFTLNGLYMCYTIRQTVKQYPLKFILGYLSYLLIFLNFDSLISLDIRIILFIPLVICLMKFKVFISEVKQLQIFWIQYKRWHPWTFVRTSILLHNLGIYLITSFPLYWGFVSTNLLALSTIAFIYHFTALCYFIQFLSLVTIIKISKSYVTRLSQNSFKSWFKHTINHSWSQQICNNCNKHPANIIFQYCGHMIFCEKCKDKRLKKKYGQTCLICCQPILSMRKLETNFTQIFDHEVKKNVPSLSNLYMVNYYFYG